MDGAAGAPLQGEGEVVSLLLSQRVQLHTSPGQGNRGVGKKYTLLVIEKRRKRLGIMRCYSLSNEIIGLEQVSVPHLDVQCGALPIVETKIKLLFPVRIKGLCLHLWWWWWWWW